MKYMFRMKSLIFCLIVAALTVCNIAFPKESANHDTGLNALYTMPSLLGAPPEHIAWSEDSKNVGFIWNKQGYQNGDIWIFSLTTGEKHQLTNRDNDAAGGISEFQWLNDQQIVYVSDGGIYSVELDGDSTLIEAPETAVSQLKASPDGKYVSYVTENGLWVSEVNEKEKSARRLLKSDDEGVSVESYRWSNDDEKLAFVIAEKPSKRHVDIHYFAQGKAQIRSVTLEYPGDETTKRQIGVVHVASAKQIIFDRDGLHDPISGYGWASDDRSLFVDGSDFMATHRTITVYDASTAAPTVYYEYAGLNSPPRPAWSAAWAPDNKGLVILSDHEGFYQLYLLSEPGGALVPLTKGEWEVASFTIDYANSQVYFIANKDHVADRQLYRVPLTPGGSVEKISTAPGTYEPFYAPDFQYVAFRFSDDETPPDLYFQRLHDAKNFLRITKSPQDNFYKYVWPDVQYVEFPSYVDGTPLFGRLALPRDFDPSKRYPLIVGPVYSDTVRNQWGGRAVHPTWGLEQVLVSQGYLLLNVNVRGSWGQGKSFRDGLKGFGREDVDDIESGVRYLVSEGYVDPERVGIWGSSYGGLMTTMSLFKKPGVYAAGVAGAPATNVWHAGPNQMRVMGKPMGDDYPARYERQSSLWQTNGLKDPLMIIHGTRDAIVEYSDSVTLVEKLIADNKMFELVTLPGANHYWGNDSVEQTRFAYKKIVEFFDRYLKPPSSDSM